MTPETARNAMGFMNRVQLQGNEVPAFIQVQQALAQLAQPMPLAPPPPNEGSAVAEEEA